MRVVLSIVFVLWSTQVFANEEIRQTTDDEMVLEGAEIGIKSDEEEELDAEELERRKAEEAERLKAEELERQKAELLAKRKNGILSSWRGWVKKYDVPKASIAISFNGKVVGREGIGRAADEPAPQLSVSKMITGICVAKLVEQEKFKFKDKLETLVPELKSSVTIASLLSHRAGFSADITQKPNARYPGVDKEYLTEISKWEIEESGEEHKEGNWRYNNSHYAMLGAVIAAVTGQTYEQACGELVLKPAGIVNYQLWDDWRILSSWGGWYLSAMDMLKFFNHYFDNETILGKKPTAFPMHDFGNSIRYGMGYVFREGRNGGFNFWHDGRWHSERDGKKYRNGSYVVRWDNGWAVATNHDISAIEGEHGILDQLLSEATHKKIEVTIKRGVIE